MTADPHVRTRISRLFIEKLHLEGPPLDTDLLATGVLDSLLFVELLLHLEREFAITISLDNLELDNFRTIENIASYIAGVLTAPLTPANSPGGPSDASRSLPEQAKQGAWGEVAG